MCPCLHGAEPTPEASLIPRNSHGCAVWLCLHAIISSTRRPAFQKGARILPGRNLAASALGIFFLGLLSFGFRLEQTAYRYASVTLTIIVLIPRTNPAWIVGLHRFIEVSVGIVVALAVVALWPEHPVNPAKNAAE
jgi:hypothetical protein